MNLTKRDFKLALKGCQKAIELNPNNAEYYNNAALCCLGMNDPDSAISYSEKAIALSDLPIYVSNLALHYIHKGCFKEALEKLLISYDEKNPEVIMNIAHVYCNLKNLEKAKEYCLRAIELCPTPEFKTNLSFLYFLEKDWKTGWPLYENRLEFFDGSIYFNKMYNKEKLWTGQNLKGKKIIVYCEQGLGDFINFVRYVKELAKLTDQVVVYVSKEIKSLFSENFNFKTLDMSITSAELTTDYDYHCSMVRLPNYLDINATVPYLKCQKIGNFAGYNNFKIGICWGGNPYYAKDRLRSCHLSLFKSINDIPNVKLFSLQKDVRLRAYDPDGQFPVDLTAGCENMQVVNLAKHINSVEDTAAFINGLDLIITVDTSVLHLAGAMGKQVFGLIPFNPDWRWGLEGESTIWYPTLRLFRQEKYDDWTIPFEKITNEVRKLAQVAYA